MACDSLNNNRRGGGGVKPWERRAIRFRSGNAGEEGAPYPGNSINFVAQGRDSKKKDERKLRTN